MGGLAPALGALEFQRLDLTESAFEIVQSTRSFALLELCVSRGTCANTVACQSRQLPPSQLRNLGLGAEMLFAIALQLGEQTEVQVTPFTHRLEQLIALLPSVHAVLGCPLLLIRVRLSFRIRPVRSQTLVERVQDIRNVIDELITRALHGGVELGIQVDRQAPRRKNCSSPAREVIGESNQLRSLWLG